MTRELCTRCGRLKATREDIGTMEGGDDGGLCWADPSVRSGGYVCEQRDWPTELADAKRDLARILAAGAPPEPAKPKPKVGDEVVVTLRGKVGYVDGNAVLVDIERPGGSLGVRVSPHEVRRAGPGEGWTLAEPADPPGGSEPTACDWCEGSGDVACYVDGVKQRYREACIKCDGSGEVDDATPPGDQGGEAPKPWTSTPRPRGHVWTWVAVNEPDVCHACGAFANGMNAHDRCPGTPAPGGPSHG